MQERDRRAGEIREVEGPVHVQVCGCWSERTSDLLRRSSKRRQKSIGVYCNTAQSAHRLQWHELFLADRLPCSANLRPWTISRATQFFCFCGQICGVGVLRGLLGAKESVWQAVKAPKSDKAGPVGVTLRSQSDKPWSSTYGVEKNMLTTLEKSKVEAPQTSIKCLKKKWQTQMRHVYQITPLFNLHMRYLEIYKWQQGAAWQAAVCFTCQLQTSWKFFL